MLKEDTRERTLPIWNDEISRDPSALRTGIGNIVYADAVPALDRDFLDIECCIVIVVEQMKRSFVISHRLWC